MILDIDNKKNAIGTKEYPDNYHDYKDEENYDVDKEPSTLEEWEAMQGDEQQPIGNVSERGDSQLQSTRQDNTYKRTNTLPPSTEAADTYWQWAKERDKEIRRNNPRDYKTIADYYLRNNPQPTLPEDDIKAERRRANFAMLSEALHLLVDIGSAVGGGNVYKREPHALRAVLDSKGRREALIDSYRRNLLRWQDAYAKVIGDASQEDRDRTIDIFRTIYPAYTSLDKEMLRQDNRLELEAEKQKNALERQERAQKAQKALEDYKNNLRKNLYKYKGEQLIGVWFPGRTQPLLIPKRDKPFYDTIMEVYIAEMGLPQPFYDKRNGKWVIPTKAETDIKKSENKANMNSGQTGAVVEGYGGTVNLDNPKAGTRGGNNQGKKPKKPF